MRATGTPFALSAGMDAALPHRYTGPERRTSVGDYSGIERRTAMRGMESRVKLFGHAVHQQLIVFPVGLLVTAVLLDIVHLAADSPTAAPVACWLIGAGVIGGLLAAPFGLIDWLAIPKGTRAKRVGGLHGAGNVIVLLLFAGSWWLRSATPEQPPAEALALSFVGVALAAVTAWLGGELVSRLGIGVSPDAGPNASSSLRR